MKTRSTEEAMDLLKRFRRYFITLGRHLAVTHLVGHAERTVHSRQVRAAMEAGCAFDGYTGNDYWLGAVFNCSVFEWTGEFFVYSDKTRNIHERTVKLWKLRDVEAASEYIPIPQRRTFFKFEPVSPQRQDYEGQGDLF
jgi:hypothetical protein